MMKIAEKAVIAAAVLALGKLKFHFLLIIHSKRQLPKFLNSKVLIKGKTTVDKIEFFFCFFF